MECSAPASASTSSHSLLSRLSFMDRVFGIDGLSTHCGYVLPRESANELPDVAELEGAMGRVADKWRLVAGRVELGEVSPSWRV